MRIAHIANIINIQPMCQPSADQLRWIISETKNHLRMLKRFDIDTDGWSAIICVVLLGKLDDETRKDWEAKSKLPVIPGKQ